MTRWVRRRTAAGEEGYTLVVVVGAVFVLSIFVAGALSYAVQSRLGGRKGQDFVAALAAAQAGVDDYLAKLNDDDNYWQGNPDCDNDAMRRPQAGSPPACGWGPATSVGWKRVATSATASFHYDADVSTTYTQGTITLTSTGRVGDARRSVRVVVRRGGFGEYLYYTDLETIDPATVEVYGPNNTSVQATCSKYAWSPYNRPDSPCRLIQFAPADVLNGPVHSNDRFYLNSARFKSAVTTASPDCRQTGPTPPPTTSCYRSAGGTPTFDKGIAYREIVPLPASVANVRQYADPTMTANPGCLYTGSTRIKFNGNGTMTVWSTQSEGPLNPGCGNAAAAWPQTLPVPANKVVYVQNRANPPAALRTTCGTGAIGDGFPVASDFNELLPDNECYRGNVLVEGTLKGRTTVISESNILITGDLTYAGGTTGTDALGLIANDFVRIYHPLLCTLASGTVCSAGTELNRPNGTRFTNPRVYAAILTLNHSFTVQQYALGTRNGALTIYGSIAQKYRGPVGTSSGGVAVTGYDKDYNYDVRLRFAPPPFFLDPSSSPWGVKAFAEVKTPGAYRP